MAVAGTATAAPVAQSESTAATGGVMVALVVIWGLGMPVTKLISAPPLVAVSVRFLISIPVVWLLVYPSRRRMSRAILRDTALPGVLLAANLAFVFAALQHSSVAVLSVILALQPGVVLLFAGRWLGERAAGWHVGWTVVGVAGVILVVLGGNPEIRGDAAGLIYSALSMLTFTTFYVLTRRARSTTAISPFQWMAGVTLFAGIAITPLALLVSSPDDYRQLAGADWLYLAFIAFVVGVLGHTLMSWAHRFIVASRSSLYLLAMNVVAVAAAWPVHDEPVTLAQAIGGAIVLGAIGAVLTRPAERRVADAPPCPGMHDQPLNTTS